MCKNVLQINIAYLQLVAHVFVCVLGKTCVYMFTHERGTGNEMKNQKNDRERICVCLSKQNNEVASDRALWVKHTRLLAYLHACNAHTHTHRQRFCIQISKHLCHI